MHTTEWFINFRFLALAVAFVGLVSVSVAKANDWDHRTKITFSGPVQVENTQLPAGTYTFRLMDNEADRHIVQIFNADETHLLATVMAIPDSRLTPTGTTSVKFSETSGGSEAEGSIPEQGLPIKEWFYPGETFGDQFRVKRAQPVAAAQPIEPAPVAAESPAPVAAAEPAQPAPVAVPAEPAQTSPVPATQPQADQTAPTADQTTPSELPITASDLPTIGLLGVLALVAAASFRIILKVTA